MPIWYGGDYNPEQWPQEVWDEDVQLMQRAGVNLATVGVFSWAKLEPREGEFEFDWLDTVLDKLHEGGIRVDLATATASPPPWLTHHYPEVLPVTETGVRLAPGSRQQYCPSSPVYRRLAARLVTALAERYADHPALELWHINNEYGCHVSHCYCDVSAEAFRRWLEVKYGTIGALNTAWGTAFWSQQYAAFEEVRPPSAAPTFRNPTQLLDFDRFSSDELLGCFGAEAAIVRAASPGVPVTTNFMGFFKPVDYWRWAAELDVISDDSYPDPADPLSPAFGAMARDLMRSLGTGREWILMEQAPSAVNWRRRNAPKRAGQMRAWSYQAVARGAKGVLFFQWRQSVAGAEKFHSGMLPQAGTDSRVWREIEALGNELRRVPELSGRTVEAPVAIVLDWDSWWSVEQPATPGDVEYVQGLFAWYRTLRDLNIVVDFVPAGGALDAYPVVVVPSLFVASEAARDNLDRYARSGGQLLVTYQSAITDEHGRIPSRGYLGGLQETLGIRIEEFAPPAGPDLAGTGEAPPPAVGLTSELFGDAEAGVWAELLTLDGAEVIARFAGGDLDGDPAITRHSAGEGAGWYSATLPDGAARMALLREVLDAAGVEQAEAPAGVEIVRRGDVTFVLNHGPEPVRIALAGTDLLDGSRRESVELKSQGVVILGP
jgi:beta-galactosidase